MELVNDGLIVRKGFVEAGIRLVHLITGEDVLGRVLIGDGTFRVERAVTPNIGSEDGTRFRVFLTPYRPYVDADTTIDIDAKHVVFSVPVSEQMERIYIETTSRITVAHPSNISL